MIYSKSMIGREFTSNTNEDYLFFSGTSYLGLSSNIEFHKILFEGFETFGSNHPMSRASNIRYEIYDIFEDSIAQKTGLDACLTLSSGFLSGKLLVEFFTEDKYDFFISPETHPALWSTLNNSQQDQSHDQWITSTLETLTLQAPQKSVIMSNSLNSLSGKVYGFNWLSEIPKSTQCKIIIDDSHGFGLLGENHKGIIEHIRDVNIPDNIEVIIISSLGKALGTPGGVILGEKETISKLKETSYYTSSSPIIPAYLYAYLHSFNIRAELVSKLYKNIDYFISKTKDSYNFCAKFPVFQISDNDIYDEALKKGIVLSSFPYPFSSSPLITRVVLNAAHTSDDIDYLCHHL